MIIVNQNKDVIVNFDNIVGLQIEDNGIEAIFINNDDLILAEYKTEERAKEVLQEIIKTYKTTEGYKCSNNLSFHKELIEDAERNNRDVFLYVMPSK